MTPLTRVQITQRNRARRKIMKEEFSKVGISERRLYLDDHMYKRIEELGKEYTRDANEMMFLAMREFLKNHDTEDTDWENHPSMLEMAVMNARIAIDNAGLGDLREAEEFSQKTISQ